MILLGIFSIPFFFVVLFVDLFSRIKSKKTNQNSGRTILLTGGKMTKCLQLARLFHANGDKVIIAETPLYKFCGTRFSKAVDSFFTIPKIENSGTSYCNALIDIAQRKNVDMFVPVASPKAAFFDSVAKPNFPDKVKVFHFEENIVRQLDDKQQFIEMAKSFGLSVPKSLRFDSKEKLLTHRFSEGKKYILKKIDYDPIYRLDLRTLPHEGWEERVKALPISEMEPWVLQEFIEGKEVCTHTTTQNGEMNMYICSNSSPFQVNYRMLHLPKVKQWVTSFVKKLNATGQISFDFIIRDNVVYPIECNPRAHSAITLFHNQPEAAKAYYEMNNLKFEPDRNAGHTYWLYHELYKLVRSKNPSEFRFIAKRIWSGKEAIFSWNDPWPFWFSNHVSIPYQIIQNLKKNLPWSHIDFNIGKLVVPGGD